MPLESPVSLIYFILSLILVTGPQDLYGNQGCLKCISGINLSPANKNVFIIFIHFIPSINLFNTVKTK